MRRLTIVTASAMLGIALSLSMAIPAVHADEKVHCKAVMKALGQGKKADEVASDMNIPTSSVYRCLRKANKAAMERETREHAAAAGAASAEASPSESAP
ncbi:MAG: hypothetical protein ACLQDV_25730 [Candidatus Binataceae bacterium]